MKGLPEDIWSSKEWNSISKFEESGDSLFCFLIFISNFENIFLLVIWELVSTFIFLCLFFSVMFSGISKITLKLQIYIQSRLGWVKKDNPNGAGHFLTGAIHTKKMSGVWALTDLTCQEDILRVAVVISSYVVGHATLGQIMGLIPKTYRTDLPRTR